MKREVNMHCFQSMDWTEAQQQALRLGGHLLVINDENESQWLIENYIPTIIANPVWIGLYDVHDEGNWIWVDGSPISFTNWGSRRTE